MQIGFKKNENVFPTFTPIKIQYFPFKSSGNRILDIHTSWGKYDFILSFYWKVKPNRLKNNGN